MRIGFVYDPPRPPDGSTDGVSAEYEDARTITWIRDVLKSHAEVVEIPWSSKAAAALAGTNIDVIFNITEAAGTRNRESLVPALAEALGIPCTGSDSVGLGISLDKYLTKVIARHEGVPTPGFVLIRDADIDRIHEKTEGISFPIIIKPNTGGSSMGIQQKSRVETREDLEEVSKWVINEYQCDVLGEQFVVGMEYTSGILNTYADQLLPIAEVRLNDGDPSAFYSIEQKSVHRKEIVCPANLSGETEKDINDFALRIFNALGCRDFARVDFRLSGNGVPYFLEINPLPGLSPFYSIFPVQAEKAGIHPEELILMLVESALNR